MVQPLSETEAAAPTQTPDCGVAASGSIGGAPRAREPFRSQRPAAQPAPSEGAARPVFLPTLDMSQLLRRQDTEECLDSSRRRERAAAKAAGRLMGSAAAEGENGVSYANPQSHRFNYEEITTHRDVGEQLNPVCRELYLHDSEFVGLFGMEKKDFYLMRLWKQRSLKKKVGLW